MTIERRKPDAQRLTKYKIREGEKPSSLRVHTSELSKVVTPEVLEKAYINFIKQADANVESKRAKGSQIPYGLSKKPMCDGAKFGARYGQGAPSATPYMNWWAVSIYYIPENGNIIMGIEQNRYPHLNEMEIKPLRYESIGNRKTRIAVFYSTTKERIDYRVLHEKFITVCEEVMRLGLK